ncbi:MAG: polysaccharide biosynthesis/export family protein [Gemmatimonadota bacterium]|nr:polysaccharide biosynthesis/export family protein [Gemmatimonadota bacterium]
MLPSYSARCFLVALPLPGAAQSDLYDTGYSLNPGDRIEIELYTDAGVELTVIAGERTVDEDGQVFLPFVGSLRVIGMRQDQLRDTLKIMYEEFYAEPVLDVQVSLNVRVTGAIFSAGRYYLAPTATLLDAITEAGGMMPELSLGGGGGGAGNIPSDQSRVRLVRNGVSHVLNLRPDEVTDSVLNLAIRSGDWIHVPNQARSRVRDELQFWGGVISFVANLVAIIIFVGN